MSVLFDAKEIHLFSFLELHLRSKMTLNKISRLLLAISLAIFLSSVQSFQIVEIKYEPPNPIEGGSLRLRLVFNCRMCSLQTLSGTYVLYVAFEPGVLNLFSFGKPLVLPKFKLKLNLMLVVNIFFYIHFYISWLKQFKDVGFLAK